MSLNEQQQQALEQCVEAYKNHVQKSGFYGEDENEVSGFAIYGAGGTGKTYTAQSVKQAFDDYEDWMVPTLVLAPTNKALKVIKNSFDNTGGDFATIHSAVGLQPDFDENGNMKFTKNRLFELPAFDGYRLVIVDEASMVDSRLTEKLIEKCAEVNAFLLVLGDQYQHLPVGEKTCPLITKYSGEHNSITLTRIMRQGGNNPVSKVIAEAREAVIKGKDNYDPRYNFDESQTYNDNGVEVGYYALWDFDKVLRQMHRAFKKAYDINDFDFAKVVCWKNDSALELNLQLRQTLWGEYSKYDFIPGDLLICRSPVTEKKTKKTSLGTKMYETTSVHTSAEGMIVSDPIAITEVYQNEILKTSYKGWVFDIELLDSDKRVTVKVLSLGDSKRFYEDQEMIRKVCINNYKQSHDSKSAWVPYFIHRKLFHDFKHAYCINSHLSQGSTYKNCFGYFSDISLNNFNKELRNRSHYVTSSRAALRLIGF